MLLRLLTLTLGLVVTPLLNAENILDKTHRYGIIHPNPLSFGLHQTIEKYIKNKELTLRQLVEELCHGSGVEFYEVDDPHLEVRLAHLAPQEAYLQHGELGHILASLVDGYQLVYDPLHGLLGFRIKPVFLPLIQEECYA